MDTSTISTIASLATIVTLLLTIFTIYTRKQKKKNANTLTNQQIYVALNQLDSAFESAIKLFTQKHRLTLLNKANLLLELMTTTSHKNTSDLLSQTEKVRRFLVAFDPTEEDDWRKTTRTLKDYRSGFNKIKNSFEKPAGIVHN